MSDMIRYSKIEAKNQREMVLLKGYPCVWGKCAFCDYTEDNETKKEDMLTLNHAVLEKVTGVYGVLEVINSGSVFELPKETLAEIKDIVEKKNIQKLFFESHYSYKKRLPEIKDYFGIPIIFKCGIETFDDTFRNKVLKKGFVIESIEEVKNYFSSVCLLVGVKGQTKEMIQKDIDILVHNFEYGCVNVYVDNTTPIKGDKELIRWFEKEYAYLEKDPRFEILWHNTDLGVGGLLL